MDHDEKPLPEYQKPEVKDYGDLTELTNATEAGLHVDLPMGTLASDHDGTLDTFS